MCRQHAVRGGASRCLAGKKACARGSNVQVSHQGAAQTAPLPAPAKVATHAGESLPRARLDALKGSCVTWLIVCTLVAWTAAESGMKQDGD